MIKIFTLLNIAGLFLFNLLFVGDVGLVQDLPAKMEPGTEVKVTVTINKDQISGFAKLQIDLPAGLSATAIETKGASFTFADGKAKFIWMALPVQPSFKVSYTLSADANASGTLPVTARLSYIQDNERKTVDMAPATVTLSGGGVVASSPAPAPKAANNTENNNGGEVIASDDGPATAPQASNAASGQAVSSAGSVQASGPMDQAQVSASRTISAVSPTEMLVTVTVRKGLLRGFGKLQENLPEGFTAVAKENDDAIFSSTGRIVKYVWLNLPSKDELTVSYRLLVPAGAAGAYTVNGEFGYLRNDLTERAPVGITAFNVEGAALAANPPATAPPATTPPTSTPVTAPPVPEPEKATPPIAAPPASNPVATNPPASNPVKTDATAASKQVTPAVPAQETGITYKVQITAAHREVGKPYFIQRHHYSGDFSIEHNDGWIKYVTGMFDRYNAARDQRQAYIDAKYNFPGPFVTAYNNGERITVQEALMIAKQRSAQ